MGRAGRTRVLDREAFPSAIFAWLDQLGTDELREIVTDAWRNRAPKRLVKARPEIS